jgi:ribosomal protein L35AE/L33A
VEASTGTYVDPGATWTDIVDGSGSVVAYSGSVNMQVLGTYVIEYRKVDSSSNTSNILSRTVTVVDTTAPKVILNGASTITIEAGSSFAEQ